MNKGFKQSVPPPVVMTRVPQGRVHAGFSGYIIHREKTWSCSLTFLFRLMSSHACIENEGIPSRLQGAGLGTDDYQFCCKALDSSSDWTTRLLLLQLLRKYILNLSPGSAFWQNHRARVRAGVKLDKIYSCWFTY